MAGIDDLPDYISWMFISITLATLYILYYIIKSVDKQTGFIAFLLSVVWLTVIGKLAQDNYFMDFNSVIPRFMFAFPPMLIAIIGFFLVKNSRTYIAKMPIELLTYLSIIRIPVELVLWWLMLHGKIPELMTFEGRNLDVIAGITAPVVAYFCFTRKVWNIKVALVWNYLGIVLLLNIIINALLSAPLPFQQFAFDQPNIGLLHFPFIWLPAFVAPVVLFSHLANIMIINKQLNE